MKVKDFGQVFTPLSVVKDILNTSEYMGENILNKHVIDNSCGDGAFLVEIVDRYINAYRNKYGSLNNIKSELEKYIHGIEYDLEIYEECLKNLKEKCMEYNLTDINFDILNKNTLKVKKYNRKMDFVVGNPPYVRVHNLNEQYANVKQYSFCESGMTDLYIVFYEIGLRMLKKHGILCYISPNSFYSSLAGEKLREYIKENQSMELLMDLGHYQPFTVTTYTTICKIKNGAKYDICKYYKYNMESGLPEFISDIKYEDLFVDNNIILSSDNSKFFKYLNYKLKKNPLVIVKNGFATLNDKIFIQDSFDFDDCVIDVMKGSTSKWKKCIFPYDENSKLISFEKLDKKLQNYFNAHKKELLKESQNKDSDWYGFGRTQALNDVKKDKISINTCIKDTSTIKLNWIRNGQGLYSGLYMITDVPFEKIKEIIISDEFIEYLRVLNKCKSGGYFTFSTKDLSKYINCKLEEEMMNNENFINKVKESFNRYLETGSRSNKKLKILHGAIAQDLQNRLGNNFEIHSLGFKDSREINMRGKYMDKKVDIAVKKDGEVIGAIALKFIMRNYSQNSNNYFENMLGETANIRMNGKLYFQIVVLPSKVPYFNKEGKITRIETISEHNLSKYIELSKDNIDDCKHTPNKMLLYLVDITDIPSNVKTGEEYKEFYKKLNSLEIKECTHLYEFGNVIIYNDYDLFMKNIVNSIVSF